MSALDVGARIRATAVAAIDKACLGEDFGVDCAPIVAQAPGGGVVVVYQIITTTRSPLLGQGPLMNVTVIQSASPTGEQVEQAVAEAMRGLRELASKILADGNAASSAHTR